MLTSVKSVFPSRKRENITAREIIPVHRPISGILNRSSTHFLNLKNCSNLAVYFKHLHMRKVISIFVLSLLSVHLLIPVPFAEASVSLTAPSAIIIEPYSQKIIYSRAPHRRQSPASTAKVVTALVAFDHLQLDQWVTIHPDVETREASKLYLHGGDRLRVRDLLKAVLMKSANDAAAALAIEVGGSERAFAQMMTDKARSLGALNTRFVNATGLPAEGQYSTPYDLAIIMREAMNNDFIVSTMKQKNTSITTYQGRTYHIKSHNKMLWRRQRVIGKTGWTRSAKYCFVGLINEGSKEAIVSVMGSKKLWLDLASLVERVTGIQRSDKILSYGSRGPEVTRVQTALKNLGYFQGTATGFYGSKTQRAIMRFQRAQRIPADGTIGTKTKEALAPYS